MKSVVKKFRKFLDTDFEVKLPHQKSKPKQEASFKPQSNYVNPFKHQQELQAKERAHIVKPSEPIRHHEPIKHPDPVQPIHQHIPEVKPAQHTHKTPLLPKLKRPAFLDKKLEITIQKPNFKLPKLPKPRIIKPTQQAPKAPEPVIAKPVAPQIEIKPPEVQIVPEIKVPEVKTPQIKKTQMKLPSVSFKKPEIHIPKPPKLKAPKLTRKQGLVFAGLLVGFGLFGGFAYSGFKLPFPTHQPSKTAQAEAESVPAEKLAEAVGKKADLPTGEEPESATVSDATKLQDQEFFKEAQNGDKILMYKRAKKAYLYRPSTDEVIATAPLVFQDKDVAGAETSAVEEPEPTTDPNAPKTSIAPEPPHGKVLVPAHY